MIRVEGSVNMNFDTKYLIRWGIPGWIFILIISLYFFFFADESTLTKFTDKNVFFVGVTFALIGIPLGYVFNQLHMYFDWVVRKNWDDFFQHEINIDEYFVDGKGYPERYRYLLTKKHEVGSVLVAFMLSTIIVLFLNITHKNYFELKWLFLFVLIILSVIWWQLRSYSTKNAWAHYEHLRSLACPQTTITEEAGDTPEDATKYERILFEPREIMVRYKDEESLESIGQEELKIIINTIENEIQQKTSYTSFFASILSIMIALVIVVFATETNIIIKAIGVILYLFIAVIYLLASTKEINKLHAYLRMLRFIKENKK